MKGNCHNHNLQGIFYKCNARNKENCCSVDCFPAIFTLSLHLKIFFSYFIISNIIIQQIGIQLIYLNWIFNFLKNILYLPNMVKQWVCITNFTLRNESSTRRMQPIYAQKITIFGPVWWLAIEDVDIFCQDIPGFSYT